jgi:hypothetical protein
MMACVSGEGPCAEKACGEDVELSLEVTDHMDIVPFFPLV